MTVLRFREPRERDEAYLRFLRSQPCCVPGCHRPSEAAHLRFTCGGKANPGMQMKPHDRHAVPLCGWHHREAPDAQHKGNEQEFWARLGLDPLAIAARLYAIGGGRPTTKKPRHRSRARYVGSVAPHRWPTKREIPKRRFPKSEAQHSATRSIDRRISL